MKNFLRLIFIFSFFYSCDVVFEKDISNNSVELISPSQKARLQDSIVNFYWNSVEDARKYRIQIANPNFYNAKSVLIDTILEKTSFQQVLKNGTYQWRAYAFNSEYQTDFTTHDFTVQLEDTNANISNKKILLIAPSNQVKIEKGVISFNWESIKEASNYTFQIAYPTFENSVQLLIDTVITNTNIKKELPTGDFQWRVRANNENYQTQFTTNDLTIFTTNIADITSEKVNLIAPSDNTNINQGTVQFNWEKLNEASTYQLQIATPNFDAPVQILTDTVTSELSYRINLPSNSYQWRVKAFNTTSETLFSTHSLVVNDPNVAKNITADKIVLLAPSNGVSIGQGNIKFNWNTLNGATQYHFQIAIPTFENPVQIIEDITIANSSHTVNLTPGNYQWRVKGKNTTYETTYTTSTLTITP